MNLTYADKPWLKHYDEGVDPMIEVPDHPLPWLLEASANKSPDNVAIAFMGQEISYRELNETVDAVAAGLAASGFKKGDRAIIYMPNTPQFIMIYFGVLRAGGIVIATNPLYSERELQHQLQDCGAETVFVMSRYYPMLKNVQRRGKTQVKRVIATHIKSYLPSVKRILYGLLKEKNAGDRITLEAGDTWFKDFLAMGKQAAKPDDHLNARRYRPSAVHGGHNRCCQGCHCRTPKPGGQCTAAARVDSRFAIWQGSFHRCHPLLPFLWDGHGYDSARFYCCKNGRDP